MVGNIDTFPFPFLPLATVDNINTFPTASRRR